MIFFFIGDHSTSQSVQIIATITRKKKYKKNYLFLVVFAVVVIVLVIVSVMVVFVVVVIAVLVFVAPTLKIRQKKLKSMKLDNCYHNMTYDSSNEAGMSGNDFCTFGIGNGK